MLLPPANNSKPLYTPSKGILFGIFFWYFFFLVYAWCCDSHLTDQWLRQLIVGDACHNRFRERWLRDGLGDAAQFGGCGGEHGQVGLRFVNIHCYGTDTHLIGPCHMHLMLTAAAEKVCRNHRLKIITGQRPQRWGLHVVFVVVVVRWLLVGSVWRGFVVVWLFFWILIWTKLVFLVCFLADNFQFKCNILVFVEKETKICFGCCQKIS